MQSTTSIALEYVFFFFELCKKQFCDKILFVLDMKKH